MNVTPLKQRFILHFGEMGSRWGINRTFGQIYAFLYVSEKPKNADEIVQALGFSRSNVSMSLKELQSWNLVRSQHLPADRREYFSAPEDIWEIFRVLVEERRKREIDPTLTMLRDALMEEPASDEDRYAARRMGEMHELIELATSWINDVRDLPPKTAIQLMKLGGSVSKLLKPGKRRGKPAETADA